MVFSKRQYRNLLKNSEELKAAGKSLSSICESDFNQLLRYSAKTWAQLEWESRDFYAEIMENFLNGKISEVELKAEFLKIQESHEQVQEALESNLIILSPNPNSDYIADLIDKLYWVLEDLSVDSTLSLDELESLIKENKYEEVEKKKLRKNYNDVKKIYLKMQKFLEE